ncbi:alpha/beta fold hydrolase [Thalassotalea agarivorans]|uniref:Pimeloyl-ACP methyl ester carboxylesterase n=1 Tax=Thalassotalea agarivorans TaxID=349064 RepID=A0A1I0FC20_THASX|nr:alpha/beta fold hydrolase [Thalassotalea agarivorans]SET55671.1 Pimeloyl-ACP methyl ester carboxylesterase [Thalassotalea agarivorans]
MQGIEVSGQGPIVLFFHSSLSSAKQWHFLAKQLSQSYTCINVDMYGYGKAPQAPDLDPFSFNIEIARLAPLFKEVIQDRPFHIVGHSCGGALALKLATLHAEKVLSLSLFEPVAFHLLPQDSEEAAISNQFSQQLLSLDNVQAARTFTDFWNRKGFFDGLPQKLQIAMSEDMNKVRLDSQSLNGETYGVAELSEIAAPVLLMKGSNSPHLSRFLVDHIASMFDEASVEELPGGHMAPLDNPVPVFNAVTEHIKKAS